MMRVLEPVTTDRVETKAGQIQISAKPDELLCHAYD